MLHVNLKAITLASTLILSIKGPQKVSISGNHLWISDPKIITAQPLAPQQALVIGNQLGEAFIFGLSDNSLNRAIVTTTANHLALSRCPRPQALLRANSDGSLGLENWSKEFAKDTRDCGFDFLSVSNPSSLNDALLDLGPSLQKIHLSPSMASVSRGRVHWYVENEKIPDLKKTLGSFQAFCDFQERPSKANQALIFKLDLFEFSSSAREHLDLSASSTTSLIGSSTSQNSKLGLLYEKAKQSGRLLASPQLRATPGKKASFNTGGEIPVQDSNLAGSKTTWKSYGLNVGLTPQEGATPNWPTVSTKVEIQYLQPDYGTGSADVPAMITRNLNNEFDLSIGQTTLLSSMIYIHQNQSRQSQSGLGAIPLLGSIFSSSGNHNNESELWFLLTPEWANTQTPPSDIYKTWNAHGKL